MAFVPMTVVPAPEPRGARYGLFTAAAGPLDLPPRGRAGGVQYEPVSCGRARLYEVACDDSPASKTFDSADAVVEAEPFAVYATYVCGAAGHTGAALEDKVLRRLANGEQAAAEQALATGLATAATPVTAPDPSHLPSVVGELQAWLYGVGAGQAAYGNVGYLHAPARLESYASDHGLIVRDGQVLRTQLGTVWIFGGGYPDDGTVYISGHVTVWRDPQVLVSPAAQVLDRTTNEYRLLAEREYAVAWDCHVASTVFDVEGPS